MNFLYVIPILIVIKTGIGILVGARLWAVGNRAGSFGIFVGSISSGWVGDVKGILEISSRMLLRYKKSIKVPETSLDEACSIVSTVKI